MKYTNGVSLPVEEMIQGNDKKYIILEVTGEGQKFICKGYETLQGTKPVYYNLIDAEAMIKKINNLEKENNELSEMIKTLEEAYRNG